MPRMRKGVSASPSQVIASNKVMIWLILLHWRHQIGADRLGRAVIAIACQREMDDAGRRQQSERAQIERHQRRESRR